MGPFNKNNRSRGQWPENLQSDNRKTLKRKFTKDGQIILGYGGPICILVAPKETFIFNIYFQQATFLFMSYIIEMC